MGKRLANETETVPTKKKKLNGCRYQKRRDSNSSTDSDSSDDEAKKVTIDPETPLPKKLDESLKENEQSPRPIFQLSGDMVNGTILTDIKRKQWRIGRPVGKGSFGEIFLASDNIKIPVTKENAKFVVKIEPHSNGPLFVEIHCLLNVNKKKNDEEESLPPGVPSYIASGSHYFRNERYRFLILPRFDRELYSIIKHCRVSQKSLLVLAVQVLDILKVLHDKGYCHSDIKAENLMISKCTYKKSLINHYKSKDVESDHDIEESNDEETKSNSDSDEDDVSEDDDEEDTDSTDNEKDLSDVNESNECSYEKDSDETTDDEYETDVSDAFLSESNYKTPNKRTNKRSCVQFTGSNPVRSCRFKNNSMNSTYHEMVTSHYLRPSRKVNYSSFFHDENSKSPQRENDHASDNESCASSVTDVYTPSSFRLNKRIAMNSTLIKSNRKTSNQNSFEYVTEHRLFLIDYGLASKFVDGNGIHRPFCMDQRRAHDGTLEFTSRDAHMGAHSRRSDLECFGYNLIFWSQGFLPWKEKAASQQPEKVHGMKEYLMTDVRQMLKHIYGKQVPKYLGEFMYYVGKLAYDERPDYEKLKMIFLKEYKKLGYKVEDMKLELNDLIKNSVNVKHESQNKSILTMKNIKNVMKNLGVILPFQESNVSRVSPKNLRSKEKNSSKKKKKFSWAEILSQDPDQIARERAEKEFERESTETPVVRFTGKPTYAILEIQTRLKKFKDRLEDVKEEEEEDSETENLRIKGYTKQMIYILKKKQQSLFDDVNNTNTSIKKFNGKSSNNQRTGDSLTTPLKEPNNRRPKDIKRSKEITPTKRNKEIKRTRNKEGLRTTITPTKRGLDYNHSKEKKKQIKKKISFDNTCTSTNKNCDKSRKSNGITKSKNDLIENNTKKKNQTVKANFKSLRSKKSTKSSNTKISSSNHKISGCDVDEGIEESSCSSLNSNSSSNEHSRSSAVSSKKSTRSKSSITSLSSSTNATSVTSSLAAAALNVPQSSTSSLSSTTQKIICNFSQTLKTVTENENSNSSTNSTNSCITINSNDSFPPASLSDEDTRDIIVSFPPRSSGNKYNSRTRNLESNGNTKPPINRVRIKLNGAASIVKEINPVNNNSQNSVIVNETNGNGITNGKLNGVNRRKKSIPQKRNVKSEYLRCV